MFCVLCGTRFSEYEPWNYPPARLLKSHAQHAEGLMQPCDNFRDHRTCSIPRIIDFISEVNSVPNSVPYENGFSHFGENPVFFSVFHASKVLTGKPERPTQVASSSLLRLCRKTGAPPVFLRDINSPCCSELQICERRSNCRNKAFRLKSLDDWNSRRTNFRRSKSCGRVWTLGRVIGWNSCIP